MKKTTTLFLLIIISLVLSAQEREYLALQEKVANITGLAFKKNVTLVKMNSQALRQFISDYFYQEYPQSDAYREAMLFYLLGFSDQLLDLRQLRLELLVENAAGFYDDRSQQMIIRENLAESPIFFNLIVGHELRHALQDQHFSLAKIFSRISDYDDRKLTRLALVEGDATLVMLELMGIDPHLLLKNFDMQMMEKLSIQLGLEQLKNAPPIISAQMIMPYIQGLKFVLFFYERGGWPEINKIYQHPPSNTYQIYSPQAYLNKRGGGEFFNFNPLPDFEIFHQGVIGYHNWNLLFNTEKLTELSSWQADSFSIYKKGEQWLMAVKFVADQKEANRFFTNWQKLFEKKFALNFSHLLGTGFIYKGANWFWYLKKDRDHVLLLRTNNLQNIRKFLEVNVYGN